MSTDINLYYWDGVSNLGDILSEYIIRKISENNVVIKNPFIKKMGYLNQFFRNLIGIENSYSYYKERKLKHNEEILFAIGSILDFAPPKSIIWGSGFREYDSKRDVHKVYAVRGNFTKKLLGKKDENIVIGDPGVLMPLIYPLPNKLESSKICFIPHYLEKNQFEQSNINNYTILDIKTTNIEHFVDNLTSYEYILSSSLHGIIIAHAYGKKALWIKNGFVGSSDFKYFDYFSSLGWYNYPNLNAKLIMELNNDEIEALFCKYKNIAIPSKFIIEKMQKDLLRNYPFKLKKRYSNLINDK